MVELSPQAFIADRGRSGALYSLHHMACSGGTVISKALALLPNVVLLSEMDPLSKIMIKPDGKAPFAPSDLIAAMRYAPRRVPDEVLIASFTAGVGAARAALAARGMRLVIRDHAHSQFCTTSDFNARPSLYEMLQAQSQAEGCAYHGVVTIRHPLESFLSLQNNGWRHFAPFTLAEYSRRYLAFLERHSMLDWIRYEDFTHDPAGVLAKLCGLLSLPYRAEALDLIALARLSGDSGRSGQRVAPRAHKPLSEMMRRACEGADYQKLCARMGYAPLPEARAAAAPHAEIPAAQEAAPAAVAAAPADPAALLAQSLAAAEAQNAQLRDELHRLRMSRSWRVTAPLRQLRHWLPQKGLR